MLVSVAARNASLAMSYGASRGSLAPDNLSVELWVGDPADGSSAELASTGGYVAASIANNGTTWPDAPADGSLTSALIAFAASSGAWADSPTHFLIRDADTGDEWDSGVLSDDVTVAGSGVTVRLALTVFYNDLST
jgi:hypothetical protein